MWLMRWSGDNQSDNFHPSLPHQTCSKNLIIVAPIPTSCHKKFTNSNRFVWQSPDKPYLCNTPRNPYGARHHNDVSLPLLQHVVSSLQWQLPQPNCGGCLAYTLRSTKLYSQLDLSVARLTVGVLSARYEQKKSSSMIPFLILINIHFHFD